MLGSREGFLRRGVRMAVLRADGMWTVWRERLMMFVIRGLIALMFDLTRLVWRGSRAQVEGFIPLTMSSTSCCVLLMKHDKG